MHDLLNVTIPQSVGIIMSIWNTGFYFMDTDPINRYLEILFKV